jgi:hypothetical protein
LFNVGFFIFLENNFVEEKCYGVIEEMRQCCLKWHKISLCCEGINLDKEYKLPDTKKNSKD